MKISIEPKQGNVPVTLMILQGNLDASNFEEVIEKAKEIHASGSQYLLLDMSEVGFMSSSGLVALHSMALLMRGDQPPDLEAGWNTLHTMQQEQGSGLQKNLKLLNPQPKISLTLKKTGMDAFFEAFDNLENALYSF